MLVLSVQLLVLAILYIVMKKIGKEKYCFWAGIILTLIAALRSSSVGPDGVVYERFFKEVQRLSYSGIFEEFTKEPIFYVATKLLQEIGITLQVWYAIIGGMFAFSTMYVVTKYSQQSLISILAMFSLGYYVFSFTGLRQTVAMAIVIPSFCMMEQKKYLKAVLLILLASLFHNSALIFGLIFVLRDKKIQIWQYILIVLAGLGMVLIFREPLYNLISDTLENIERFEGYAGYNHGLTWSGFVIQFMVFIFSMIVYNGKARHYLLNLSFLGVLFQMLAVMMAEFFRVSMYFNVFNIILLGNVYCENRFNQNSKKIVRVLIVAALILYFINGHLKYEYTFYWQ